MRGLDITLTGTEEVLRKLEMFSAGLPGEMRKALRQVAKEGVYADSQEDVPVKEGHLKGTGHISVSASDSSGTTARVTYGGLEAPYAVEVHENLAAQHPNGKAKFLEEPLNRRAPVFARDVAANLDLRQAARR